MGLKQLSLLVFLSGWIFLGFPNGLGAQEASAISPSTSRLFILSGRILEKGTKAPVLGGGIYLEASGNSMEAQSLSPLDADADLKGNYKISVPEGVYRLVVAGEGFKKMTLKALKVNRDMKRDFYLAREGFTLPEVVVSTSNLSPTQVSQETLSKEELTQVPGTQQDVLKALGSLPGVITAGSLSGQLLVRGSGPYDNQYYVDQVPIGYPYHIGGIVSTVDSSLVKDISFYAGGFGPQFPNSMGGLVDLTLNEPREDRWSFQTDINIFLGEAEVEGPISSNSSLSVAFRQSYLNLLIKDFTSNQGDIQVPEFGDYQVKYSYRPSSKVRWDFLALGSDDTVSGTISASATIAINNPDLAGNFNFSDGYNSQGVNLTDRSDEKNTLANSFYHTNTYLNFSLGPGLYEDTTVEDFGDKFSITRYFDSDTSLEGGLQYDHFVDSLNAYFVILGEEVNQNGNLTTAAKISSQEVSNSDDFSAFLNQNFKILNEKLDLSVGARMDYVNSDFTVYLTPRFSAAYHLSGETTLKASYGYYDESPDRILGAPYLDPNLGNPKLASEQSIDTVLGFDQKINESGLLFRVEGYEKDFSSLIVANPDEIPGQGYLNTGTGYARGIEFFLRQPPTSRFFGWIAYSLSTSVRQNAPGDSPYPYDYDEPNVFTAVGTYKINPGWDIGLKVLFSSGQPYTPVDSAAATVVSSNGAPATIYLPVNGPYNSERLPNYRRVDFSTSFKTVYNTWEWDLYLDIMNLFNTQNVLGYQYNADYTQKTAVDDLPFLPYLGIEIKY